MEEAILVVKEESIEFSNHVYQNMISRAKPNESSSNFLNSKFIRIHQRVNENGKEEECSSNELLTLSDLIQKG